MAGDRPARSDRNGGIAVAVAVDDPGLARRLAMVLRDLPDVDLLPPDLDQTAEIVFIDHVPARSHQPAEPALICMVDHRKGAAALRAGVAAVVPRSAGALELRLAIEAVQLGYLLAPVGTFGTPHGEDAFGSSATTAAPAALTRREREVLEMLAEGASNKQIARRLELSIHTVKFHVASILEKLDATGRTDAVAHAVRRGLLML